MCLLGHMGCLGTRAELEAQRFRGGTFRLGGLFRAGLVMSSGYVLTVSLSVWHYIRKVLCVLSVAAFHRTSDALF